jgi:hypothetical protein
MRLIPRKLADRINSVFGIYIEGIAEVPVNDSTLGAWRELLVELFATSP